MKHFILLALFVIPCYLATCVGYAQGPFDAPATPITPNHSNAPQMINDVRVNGNLQIPTGDILRAIKTRPGRPFNRTVIEEDVRTLMQQGWFVSVVPRVQEIPGEGFIVTFSVIERQLIHYTKIVGNRAHTRNTLLEEANIKVGDALDPIAIHQARERIAQFYRETGFHHVNVEVNRGDELGDRGVVFRISEGTRQWVLSVEFQGNRIASSERLKTLIQTKPGIFWIGSDFTRRALDDDVETLITYYRKLGFFHARVDRVFEETQGFTGWGQNRGWVRVKFIIDEGPRARIRDIRFVGNHRFSDEELRSVMRLARSRNQFFNQDTLDADIQTIRDKYGEQGYVHTRMIPDPRVDRDFVDLVININEGPRTFLQSLEIEIRGADGSESYTKWHPALNRISLRPGDILRTSEINASRRRLMHSQLFNTNPMLGPIPSFDFDLPRGVFEMEARAAEEAQRRAANDPQVRGQAPQPVLLPSLPPFSSGPVANTNANRNADVYRGQQPNWGSVAPAVTPLQPIAPPQNTASAVGMTPTQFQTGVPAGTQTGASTPSILRANPFDSPNLPSNVRIDPNPMPGVSPYIYGVDGRWVMQETQTGTLMASIAVTSDAGIMGRFMLEEQNFDILNYPRGLRLTDWRNAFRGRGQRFRLEAVPGTQVQRYSASWENPYLFDLDYSFGISGFYFQRHFDEWSEGRTGGSVSFGRLWTQDISTHLTLGGQSVNIFRPHTPVEDLFQVLGKHPMYNIGLSATWNTRDSEFMPTEGHRITAGVEQVLGRFQFIRGNIDASKYFMLRERPDRSGRWVLGLRSSFGVTEKGTPIFERYFGGGVSNLRGFEFRSVSPRTDMGYVRGGHMEFYNSAELIFPLTADDMIRGSIFIDTGTVESSIKNWNENYRVAMGFGLRLTIPMMGPAPIALDFAFPISSGRWDEKNVFSFGMNFFR